MRSLNSYSRYKIFIINLKSAFSQCPMVFVLIKIFPFKQKLHYGKTGSRCLIVTKRAPMLQFITVGLLTKYEVILITPKDGVWYRMQYLFSGQKYTICWFQSIAWWLTGHFKYSKHQTIKCIYLWPHLLRLFLPLRRLFL